jgi:hypothetical protein
MKKNSTKATGARPVGRLTKAELDKMTTEFDREFVADTFGPPTPEARTRLRRARRKPGRPRVGAGSKAISVTVEKTLLKKIDRIVRLRKTTRARLISRGLRAVLKEEQAATR